MSTNCENCRQEIGECICMDGPEDTGKLDDYDDCSKDLDYEQQYKREHMNLQEAQQVAKDRIYAHGPIDTSKEPDFAEKKFGLQPSKDEHKQTIIQKGRGMLRIKCTYYAPNGCVYKFCGTCHRYNECTEENKDVQK